jgi:hypothetical protein
MLKDNESVDNAVWSEGIKRVNVSKNGAQALWVLALFVIGELHLYHFGPDSGCGVRAVGRCQVACHLYSVFGTPRVTFIT